MHVISSIRSRSLIIAALAVAVASCATIGEARKDQDVPKQIVNNQLPEPTVMQVPDGYKVELLVQDLTYPTSVTWDDQGRMYVAEAGGAFLEESAPARILRIDGPGRATEVVNLDDKGIQAPVAGLVWHKGALYFTHRAKDRTGAVSRMTPDGTVTELFNGVIDSQTDHFLNGIRVGPDGRMYVASGVGGNTIVMGIDMAAMILKSPNAHATSAKDIVLTGRNFQAPDFRTKKQGDKVLTGAFVPFGTETKPGQVIKGRNKAGGAILAFDPDNAEATLKPYAWGFRNVVGMAWNKKGEMFACQNGYDVNGPRAILDEHDPTYRVREDAWYGCPDFSAALEPVTDPKFAAPGSLTYPVFVNGKQQEKKLEFLIDHKASGLTPPDKSLVLGLHPLNSSPSKPDVAPDSWGDMAGNLFVPEWGDMAWRNNPFRDKPVGSRIVYINPSDGKVMPFIHNAKPGPASAQEAPGRGLERPFDVKFGPDGAMYIADFGQHAINQARIAEGHLPFEWPPKTGMVWKVTRIGASQGGK